MKKVFCHLSGALSACLMALAVSGCTVDVTKETVVSVDAPENSVFTSDGRYFLTAGNSVYEIVKNYSAGEKYLKIKIKTPVDDPANSGSNPGNWTVTGIVQHGKYLYSNLNTGSLLNGMGSSCLMAAEIKPDASSMEFKSIGQISGVALANGLAIDSKGRLYVASSYGAVSAASIIRLTVSEEGAFPVLTGQKVWLHFGGGIFPNGIKAKNNTIYFTSLNTVRAVDITSDGSAGSLRVLYIGVGFFDDMYVRDDGIAFCEYTTGKIMAIGLNGGLLGETKISSFNGPSSVIEAKGGLFPEGMFLVTERGGNQLSLVSVKN